jgi:hypothetical protein
MAGGIEKRWYCWSIRDSTSGTTMSHTGDVAAAEAAAAAEAVE